LSQDKQIKKVKANKGFILPIFYINSIIHIDENSEFEIDVNVLRYEAKIQFDNAIKDKHIIVLGEK
jgi:hypothetical protein